MAFRTKAEVAAYFAGDKLVCLLCGRAFRKLGTHVTCGHGMSVIEYQDMFGIPRRRSLVGVETKALLSINLKKNRSADPDSYGHIITPQEQNMAVREIKRLARSETRTWGREAALTRGDAEDMIRRVRSGTRKNDALGSNEIEVETTRRALKKQYPDLWAVWRTLPNQTSKGVPKKDWHGTSRTRRRSATQKEPQNDQAR